MTTLDFEDIPRFLAAAEETPFYVLFYTALYTGIRRGELLGKPLGEDSLVFAHPDGAPLDPSTISHQFAQLLKKAGLPHVRFHDLRHTHATLMLKGGVHPKIVSERLGHATVAITLDTYSQVVPGLQEAAARRFDSLLPTPGVQEPGDVSKRLAQGSAPDTSPAYAEAVATSFPRRGGIYLEEGRSPS